MPSSAARPTKASKSASVPRSGWMASCPPAGEPMAQGEPAGRGLERSRPGPAAAIPGGLRPLGTREELVPGPVERALSVHDDGAPRRAGEQVAQWAGGQDRGDLRAERGTEPVGGRGI